ncbi:MAG: type IV secretory system conjugative DNA transfer family protein [Pseudobutyrivibrio sp.]|nr:type IV secretory system conjugative DNA transfer family protein [Pseudobutyrivibrio sp.]
MDRSAKYNYRYLGEDLKVSNDTWQTRLNNNDLIVGSSGSSKTGSIVYPQLKSLQDSSLIVVDTKGRLASMFTDELQAKGYKVKVLDFVNPGSSSKYNPLAYIRKNENGQYREQDIAKVAAALIPMDSTAESFWPSSARQYLEFFIDFVLMRHTEDKHNMKEVANFYSYYINGGEESKYVTNFVRENPNTLLANRHAQIHSSKMADKTRTSILSFVAMALAPFEYAEYSDLFRYKYERRLSPDVAFDSTLPLEEWVFPADAELWDDQENYIEELVLCDDVVDIASLGKEKTVLFLNVSDCDHSMDTVVNLFYTQALQTLIAEADANPNGQLDVPVRIIMDDFASSALIPDFDKIISVVRSRDIWLTLCIQSFTQLESLYTHPQAQTIINNCDHIVYLGSNDLESANYIGTRVNKSPETILSMDRDGEYILESGSLGKFIRKIPSYGFVYEGESPEMD